MAQGVPGPRLLARGADSPSRVTLCPESVSNAALRHHLGISSVPSLLGNPLQSIARGPAKERTPTRFPLRPATADRTAILTTPDLPTPNRPNAYNPQPGVSVGRQNRTRGPEMAQIKP